MFDTSQAMLISGLLWLVGLLLGYGACALLARRRWAQLDVHKDTLDRSLASSQSDNAGLQARLAELRTQLADREHTLAEVSQRLQGLEKEHAALVATHTEKMAGQQALMQAFEHAGQQLRLEFNQLANQVLEEKGRSLTQSNQTSLDALLQPFREQIKGFQQRANEIHTESVKGQASLGAEIRQVLDIGLKMSAEANSLASALKGEKKTLGNWGEIQLEQTLQAAGLMPHDHYVTQVALRDASGTRFVPDFVVKLPGDKHLVLDSKVSLVDYERAVAASTDAERQQALDAHVRAVRNHMDDLSRKDYTQLIGLRSPDFVLMFMPIEAAYMAALQHQPEIFNHGYQRHVVLVSHTTLMPILKTVANLWRVARSNEEAHKLSALAGDIYNQVATVAEHLKKVGDSLGAVGNHYNRSVTALVGRQGLYGKVQKFTDLSVNASKTMPELAPLESDLQQDRLDIVQLDPLVTPTVPDDDQASTDASLQGASPSTS